MFPNMLDYAVIIFVVLCYLLSSLRAGPKQAFSFLVIILSFYITARSYEGVSGIFPDKLFPASFAGATAFLIVFLAVFGGLSLAGRLLEDIFKRISFGTIDAFVNRGLGIIKGLMLACMVVVVIMVNYSLDESPLLSESVTLRYLMPGVRTTATLLTRHDKKLFLETDRELEQLWAKTRK